jgi:hypothetical protein
MEMDYGEPNRCCACGRRVGVLYRPVSLAFPIFSFGCFQRVNLPWQYFNSLERVPETGRWRFMDIGPSFEASIAEGRHDALLSEYGKQILPPEHSITQHVRNIVTKILEANDLGYLRADSERVVDSTLLGAQAQLSENREGAEGEPGNDYVWKWDTATADRSGLEDRERVPGSGGREWSVVVVHDPGNINAAAGFGMCML